MIQVSTHSFTTTLKPIISPCFFTKALKIHTFNDMEKYCDDKVCYSKSRAHAVMRHVQAKRNKRLRVYTCNKCFMCHLTSKV